MFPLASRIDILRALQIQKKQWSSKVLIEGTVPAGEIANFSRHISQMGHFICTSITGTFTTLSGNPIIDDGIDHLRFQLSDNTGNRKLFDDFIPGSHWLSPGRVKHASATNTPDPSNQLFYPESFVYAWEKNSNIILDVKNDSDADNYFYITFKGYRVQE